MPKHMENKDMAKPMDKIFNNSYSEKKATIKNAPITVYSA